VRAGEPLHRAVGLRRGLLARGEAELHNLHGLADYGAGDMDTARREFARAIAADPGFFDSLYNAAAAAALSDDDAAALAFLKRAAAADPARAQVLGRNDEDLKQLRKRKDVRDLLGCTGRLPRTCRRPRRPCARVRRDAPHPDCHPAGGRPRNRRTVQRSRPADPPRAELSSLNDKQRAQFLEIAGDTFDYAGCNDTLAAACRPTSPTCTPCAWPS